MAKYKVRATYPVEIKNPETGQIEIEQRPYDLEKYDRDKRLKVGDVVELTDEQLENHGEKYFDPVEESTRESETQVRGRRESQEKTTLD